MQLWSEASGPDDLMSEKERDELVAKYGVIWNKSSGQVNTHKGKGWVPFNHKRGAKKKSNDDENDIDVLKKKLKSTNPTHAKGQKSKGKTEKTLVDSSDDEFECDMKKKGKRKSSPVKSKDVKDSGKIEKTAQEKKKKK